MNMGYAKSWVGSLIMNEVKVNCNMLHVGMKDKIDHIGRLPWYYHKNIVGVDIDEILTFWNRLLIQLCSIIMDIKWYSTFVDNLATVFFFFDDQLIGLLPRKIIWPDVEALSSIFLAQPISTNAWILRG